MSIGSLGIVGSLASTPLAQKGPEADKVQRESVDHARASESESRAESAAGIGQTEEESQASERDADGRRPWQRPTQEVSDEPAATELDALNASASKDPTGERGGLIDISG